MKARQGTERRTRSSTKLGDRVGEELNQDRDIELPYLEPGEQQILDKIDEIAGKFGVEPKGKSVIEGMEDDFLTFGANVEEKSSDEDLKFSL